MLALLLLGSLAGAAEPPRYPPDSILLFVAAWCAPCQGELARLAEISRAARPFRVLVVPFDDGKGTRAMLDAVPVAQRLVVDRATQRRLVTEVERRSAGLPFSLAIDQEGQICAAQAALLDGAAAAALVSACRR
ncbi:TlpA family protein disulfide reductase [Sphingomonas azotifigens]|uniref:TlpA family protein disulfide reductase n=1 Tax=Sphingomonas azotifigens TaxID=330920 RepID=UPI000A03E062|nr:hypothetical protein [Sphingomonas azotifigens]